MIRNGQRNIIFVINNGGYGLEFKIHDGPYNVIKNWDYTRLVDAIDNGEGKCWTAKIRCENELTEAIHMAMGEKMNCLCFIEVMVEPSDLCNEAVQLGAFLGSSNSLPPLQS
ncbi:pyruvate decarboxylase 2-like [Impatiens glandulifera]|uniref:pyruvate decarboxylase 2-like n=1 Tax=Impatiens glandulifera TaxID=253017 RepID=UPI001FB12EA3|nr:pyruvate decarboxylase 2-like [Impatiens glandulifera]